MELLRALRTDSAAVTGETRSLQYAFLPTGATKSFTLGLRKGNITILF